MRRTLVLVLGIIMTLTMAGTALAQSGHFLTGGRNAPVCRDIGTQVACTFSVAGLGGTTFEVLIEAEGVASVECINPGGMRAPGQDTTITAEGSSGEQPTPRNGRANFTNLATAPPTVPNVPTCPNPQWTANVVDVTFGDATLTLLEDGQISDQITVPVS